MRKSAATLFYPSGAQRLFYAPETGELPNSTRGRVQSAEQTEESKAVRCGTDLKRRRVERKPGGSSTRGNDLLTVPNAKSEIHFMHRSTFTFRFKSHRVSLVDQKNEISLCFNHLFYSYYIKKKNVK